MIDLTEDQRTELRQYFEWQLEQMNPMQGRKNRDCWPGTTVDTLMDSPVAVRSALQLFERVARRIQLRRDAGLSTDMVAPWQAPEWRAKQQAAEQADAKRQADLAAQPSPFVTGGHAPHVGP